MPQASKYAENAELQKTEIDEQAARHAENAELGQVNQTGF
jgi:hypothetical protein